MKIFLLIILTLYSTIPVCFAQQCLAKNNGAMTSVLNLAQNSLSSTCMLQKEQYKCSELEAALEGNDKKKIIQCDAKSMEENKLSNMSFGTCIFNGIKLSGENLLDLTKLPGKIVESVAKGFHDTQLCNTSVDKKRELLTAFNLSIDDSRFKLSEQFLGKWLEDASCAEIDKLLFARYQNYQDVLMRERQSAILTNKKPRDLPGKKEDGSDLMTQLKSVMSDAQVRYECYTPRVKAEIICAGVTSLIVDTAMGMGVKSAITKINAVVKSKKALGAISKAVTLEEKVDIKDSAKLLIADRKKAAALILEKNLSQAQEKAIIEAHEIGLNEGRGYFTYTSDDLRKKAKILKEAGFNEEERALLLRSGITGEFSVEEAKKTFVKNTTNRLKFSNPKERDGQLNKFNRLLEDYRKADDPASKANYARLLGEMTQSEDINLAKGFYQNGLDKVKAVAEKEKGYFNRTKTLENYLDLAGRAGDQMAVKKGMSEFVKQQYTIDAKRLGWKSTADAANEIFDQLESEVQHARNVGAKGQLNLEAARRKQKALLEEFKFIDQSGMRARKVDSDFAQFPKSE